MIYVRNYLVVGLLMILVTIGSQPLCAAEHDLISGTWLTIDDETKQPASHVRITVTNQKLDAIVIKLLDNQDAVCSMCSDYRKNQPVLGMKIISGLSKKSQSEWGDGEILDPDNGKTYRVTLRLDNGKLIVRGYVGISLFGREQVWTRLSKD